MKDINTKAIACTAFEEDVEMTFVYMDGMKQEAANKGYISRPGRGNKGLHISFRVALHYRLQNIDEKTAFQRFKADFLEVPGETE